MAPPLQKATTGFQVFGDQVKKVKEKQDEAAKAAQKHAEKILALADAMRGLDTVRTATDTLEALNLAEAAGWKISNMTAEQNQKLNATIQAAIDVYKAAGQTIPEQWLKVANETAMASIQIEKGLDGIFTSMEKLQQIWILPPLPTIDVTAGLPKGPLPGIDIGLPTIPKVDLFSKMFGDAKDFGAKLSNAIAGALHGGGGGAGVLGAATGLMGSEIGSSVAKNLGVGLLKDGAGIFKNALGGVLSSALPMVGSLVGPLASKLWSSLFGTAGRDKVKEFASSFGGFDELHTKLNELGAEGEKLWIQLTQGTGRNNPQQAAAAIDAINAALEDLAKKHDDAGNAAQKDADQQTAAFMKTHDAAQQAIDGVNSQIKSLQDTIANEAPEEEMGVIEQQTRAKIDALQKENDARQQALDQWTKDAEAAGIVAADSIDAALQNKQYHIDVIPNFQWPAGVVPVPSGGPGATFSGSAGATGAPTAMSGGGGVGVTQVRLDLDGRTLTEIVVPNLPGVITRYGLR